jgi:hypothetical protein
MAYVIRITMRELLTLDLTSTQYTTLRTNIIDGMHPHMYKRHYIYVETPHSGMFLQYCHWCARHTGNIMCPICGEVPRNKWVSRYTHCRRDHTQDTRSFGLPFAWWWHQQCVYGINCLLWASLYNTYLKAWEILLYLHAWVWMFLSLPVVLWDSDKKKREKGIFSSTMVSKNFEK